MFFFSRVQTAQLNVCLTVEECFALSDSEGVSVKLDDGQNYAGEPLRCARWGCVFTLREPTKSFHYGGHYCPAHVLMLTSSHFSEFMPTSCPVKLQHCSPLECC